MFPPHRPLLSRIAVQPRNSSDRGPFNNTNTTKREVLLFITRGLRRNVRRLCEKMHGETTLIASTRDSARNFRCYPDVARRRQPAKLILTRETSLNSVTRDCDGETRVCARELSPARTLSTSNRGSLSRPKYRYCRPNFVRLPAKCFVPLSFSLPLAFSLFRRACVCDLNRTTSP